MYSVTYKHCPFCNEDGTGRWDDLENMADTQDEVRENRGGKRLAGGGNRRGGGYGGRPSFGQIVATIASLALIAAAVCIVVSLFKPQLPVIPGSASASPSAALSASPVPSAPSPSAAGSASPTTQPSASQPPVASTPPANLPTGFTLNREDFTFDAPGQTFQMRATFTPEGSKADIEWKSSDPNVASVSWNGMVTSVSKGTVTLTATVEGVGKRECIVRCNFTSQSQTAAPASSTSPSSSSSNLKLNREDFTLSKEGEQFRMTVTGTSSAVTWSSTNTSVATIGGDGQVTAVGKGTCKVKAQVDGVTLECIVRCSW